MYASSPGDVSAMAEPFTARAAVRAAKRARGMFDAMRRTTADGRDEKASGSRLRCSDCSVLPVGRGASATQPQSTIWLGGGDRPRRL